MIERWFSKAIRKKHNKKKSLERIKKAVGEICVRGYYHIDIVRPLLQKVDLGDRQYYLVTLVVGIEEIIIQVNTYYVDITKSQAEIIREILDELDNHTGINQKFLNW